MVKIKKSYFALAVCITIFFLSIEGCTFGSQNSVVLTVETEAIPSVTKVLPVQTNLASPTIILSATPTFTPSPLPIQLPMVTMLPQEAEGALQELLRTNGNCTGKCLAGIYPDDMIVQDAVNQMAQWGMLRMIKDKKGGTFIHLRYLDPQDKQTDVNVNMTLTLRKEAIDAISFYIPRREDGEFLGADVWLANRNKWRAFQFDNLLKAYGIPSFVGLSFETRNLDGRSIGYTMIIDYEQMNLEIGIGALAYTNGNNVFLCPIKDPHNLGIDINPNPPIAERQQASPIIWQDLTDSDLEMFYRTFTDESSPDGCFTTTLEKITALDPYFH